MSNYQAILKDSYRNKRWLRTTGYAFAMNEAILPLSLPELPKAIMSLPVAFIQQEEKFIPVGVMSIQPNRNHFITPDGRWIHGYIPASCRTYPFRFFNAPDGKQIPCIDEDSGLVTDGPEGEAFFDEAGEPTQAIREILTELHRSMEGLKAASNACEVLNRHQLITPWGITLKTDVGDKKISGLFHIDEAALNQLSAEALLELRNTGGLMLAYCQLLSMRHFAFLGELASAHAKAELAAAEAAKSIETKGNLDIDFLNTGDSLDFGGFR